MKKLKGIYIVQFENGIKFGISNDMQNRVLTYKQPWCRPTKEIIGLECQYPKLVEQKVIEYFSDFAINPSREFLINVDLNNLKEYILCARFSKKEGMLINSYYKQTKGWIKLNNKKDNYSNILSDESIEKKIRYKNLKRSAKKQEMNKWIDNWWDTTKIKNIASKKVIIPYNPDDWDF